MAADEERAARIRALKRDKHLKWQHIADSVGVRLRSAQMWAETGSISYDNAKKLAALADVDPDWIMRGTETETPDPFPDSSLEERVDRMEERLTGLIEKQNKLLDQQSGVLAEIRELLRGDGLAQAVAEAAREIAEAASPQAPAPKARGSVASRSRQA